MVDLRQTVKYAKFMENIGWTVERTDNINYFVRPFPIFGSFIKVQRPRQIDLNQIRALQKKYRVLHTIVEPINTGDQNNLLKQGYRIYSPYLPSKTLHIDLTKAESRLLKEMHQKTRYNIKIANQKNLKIVTSTNIHAFAQLWKDLKISRKLFGTKDITELHKAFDTDAHLLLAYKNEELLAGVLAIHAEKIAYYMYAASKEEGKKLYAPTILTWEQIKLAKKLKCKVFDFEGIYDGRFPLKDWKGFSRFKKGFGGKEVEYPGAVSKVKLIK